MGANITGIRLWAALAALSAAAAAHAMPKSVSRAQWLWAEPSGDPRDELTGETVAENAERFTLSADKPRVWFLEVR